MLYFHPDNNTYPTEFNLHFKRLSFRKRKFKVHTKEYTIAYLCIHRPIWVFVLDLSIDMSDVFFFGYSLPFPTDKLQNVSSPYFTYQDDVEKFSFLCLCLLALICITLSFKLLSTSRIPDLFSPLFVYLLLSSKTFQNKSLKDIGYHNIFCLSPTKIPQVMQLSTFRIKFMCISFRIFKAE